MITEITRTTDIIKLLAFRARRADRYCVSGYIRPGEYTAYYATTADEAQRCEAHLRRRGCHQIQTMPPA